ncbi:hypothetical protein KEM54_001661, partial [Ascosphaera aggregata]
MPDNALSRPSNNSSFHIRSDAPTLSYSDDVTIPFSSPRPSASGVVPSSPPLVGCSRQSVSTKVKRPPPITPRRFRRFFTPRSALRENPNLSGKQKRDGHGLPLNIDLDRKDTYLTSSPPRIHSEAPALFTSDDIENLPSSPIRLSILSEEDEDEDDVAADRPTSPILVTPDKRRRIAAEFPPSSSLGMRSEMTISSSPSKRFDLNSPTSRKYEEEHPSTPPPAAQTIAALERKQSRLMKTHGFSFITPTSSPPLPQSFFPSTAVRGVRRSRVLRDPGHSQLFTRSVAGTRNHRFALAYPGHANANPLLAIGEESGQIRLIDPSPETFSTPHLTFPVHNNAILDLSFSASDAKLATASGDQTARIVDMPTQQTTAILQRHTSSLKKVCWQDGSQEQVLATCSRDGAVAVWDLRVKCTASRPVLEIGEDDEHIRLDVDLTSGGSRRRRGMLVREYTQPLNFITGAHSEKLRVRPPYATTTTTHHHGLFSSPQSGDSFSSLGDTSVTSLLFLPAPRSNLLVTSGASDACLRLWDLRTTYALRRKASVPLAVTTQPESHSRNRQFGITSMDLNTDGTRLYALCRDRTVYVYSTRHLVVEGAGEEALGNKSVGGGGGFKHFPGEEARMGLGPLYGLRHPRLSVSTFFVKLAVRKERDGQREVLAVGSSDNCAVLFSTDE